ncbi:MAG: DUF5702 domain-containing protein [Clostridiales bacterium]|nr:DUF5702 domain-containing protein [Clostridiales bacterium]
MVLMMILHDTNSRASAHCRSQAPARGRARALLRGQGGAATVFFLLAGSALLVLFLAVFNFGRYLLAISQTETALEASAASVLSYYHPKLTGEMGLYALDTRDLSLELKGWRYFSDNLGNEGAMNGLKVLDYALSFPTGSRLSLEETPAAQALDMQRIKGWADIVQDLLQFIGKGDWQNGLKASGDTAGLGEALGLAVSAGGDPDMEEGDRLGDGEAEAESEPEAAGVWEKPDWMLRIEECAAPRPDGRLSFLQLMMPSPPGSAFVDRDMPSEGLWYMIANLISSQADHWRSLFTEPAETVGDENFLPETTERMTGFLDVMTEGLASALQRVGDKIIFNSYLLSELDFATNKPVLNRYFARCEVEYVLYGFRNSWNNIRSVAAQLLLMRTCLHVLKSLIDGEIIDEVTLAAAAINGAIKGSGEVEELFAGGKVPAFPGTSFSMTYKDHLRILLLIQREADQRRALQEIVRVNLWHWAGGAAGGGLFGSGPGGAGGAFAEYALSRYATEVRIGVEVEVPLWPFGSVSLRREGVMGYDTPFTLLPA